MNRELFQEIGLNGNLAEVYECLLLIGPASASEIAKRTKLTRTNSYMLVEKLVDLKLVTSTDSHAKVYTANNPSQLKVLLSKKQQEIQETNKNLNAALPNLVSKYRLTHQQPGVIHIEGNRGIKELFDDIIRIKQEVLIIPSDHDRRDSKVSEFIDGQILRQQLAGIPARVLYGAQDLNNEEIELLLSKNVSIRHYGESRFDAQITIYGDNVAFSTYKDSIFTTIISSSEIAQTHRAIFETMWQNAK